MLFAVLGIIMLVTIVLVMKKCSSPTCPPTILIEVQALDGEFITGSKIGFKSAVDGEVQSYLWDFGDNTTATEPSVEHIYSSVQGDQQDFTVTLTINGECVETKIVTILAAVTDVPVVTEYVRAVIDGPFREVYVGEPVQFYDKTPGEVTSWDWQFGETMNIDSHEQNPIYTYQAKGTYTVQLMVNGGKSEPGEFQVKVIKKPANAIQENKPTNGKSQGSGTPPPPPPPKKQTISKEEFVKIITEECKKDAPNYKGRLGKYCGNTLNGLVIVDQKGKSSDFLSWVNKVDFIDKCACNINGLSHENDADGDIIKITLK